MWHSEQSAQASLVQDNLDDRCLKGGVIGMLIKVTPADFKKGLEHVTYEYVSLLAGAWEMTEPHMLPVNVLLQDATLTHIRTLAEFFSHRTPLGIQPAIDSDRPDLRACLYSTSIDWEPKVFVRASNLMQAIDKCVAHLSLARIVGDPRFGLGTPWNGPAHLHGTIRLMLDTWEGFETSILPQFRPALDKHLAKAESKLNCIVSGFWDMFHGRVAQLAPAWKLGQLP